MRGFFGREHEKNDREWDSNGEALWAIGRFDRILGGAANFGRGLFTPYVIDGARWIRDNRTIFGLLPSGWSAEHVGDKGQPHYWDDFWGLAGLWEAARLAQRTGVGEADEIWRAYDSLRTATADSIRWVLDEQQRRGHLETFIPTGPGDVGRLDSTIIGALCYFHPCRLYDGAKLGADIDGAARMTLDTIWGHFIDGGFRHDSAWNSYGPYLTLQLAHAFLLIGDVGRFDQCLQWVVGNAAKTRLVPGRSCSARGTSNIVIPSPKISARCRTGFGTWATSHMAGLARNSCFCFGTFFSSNATRMAMRRFSWRLASCRTGWTTAR